MITRRDALAATAVAWPLNALAAPADVLEGQPPLPAHLGKYLDVALRDIDGRPTTMGALVSPRRPTVVSFWATWCAPCLWEGQRLAALRSAVPDGRLAIIGINVDRNADAAKLAQFRQKARMNYLQAQDGAAAYAAFTGAEKTALPRLYVFDAQGSPTAAFGRFFGERSLRAVEAAARAVAGG